MQQELGAHETVESSNVTLSVERVLVMARLYRAPRVPSTAALLWLHGGGFISGSIDMPEGDAVARAFAGAGVPVLSVDYRLAAPHGQFQRWQGAPAVRFPLPLLDCLAGWRRLVEESTRWGVSPDRLFVGGASAGGNLAVMTALRSQESGLPPVAGLVLAYPLLHPVLPGIPAGDDVGRRELLTHAMVGSFVRWMAGCLVGSTDVDARARAFAQPDDLRRLPPAVIVTSARDGLSLSADVFADDLCRAGVEVEIRTEPGTAHGHLNQPDEPYFAPTMATFIDWLHRRTDTPTDVATGADRGAPPRPLRARRRRPLSPARFLSGGRPPGTRSIVVCAGDSITHGAMNASYVEPLQARLADDGIQVVNAGISGDIAANLLRRLDQVVACRPDVVTVLVGTNDVAARIDEKWRKGYEKQLRDESPTRETFRRNLLEIVTRLQAETTARLALIEIPPLGEELDSVHNSRVDDYNAVVHEVGASRGVPVLPLRRRLLNLVPPGHRPVAFDGSKVWMLRGILRHYVLRQGWDAVSRAHGLSILTDHVHLNDRGAGALSQLIEEFVHGQVADATDAR